MGTLFIFAFIIWAVLFINPTFASTRWPWPLTEFDARIMSAFAMLAALWALQVYFFKDWALAKLAVVGLLIYGTALVVVYLFTVNQYGPTNREAYGIIIALFTVVVAYFYWRQEQGKKDFQSALSQSTGSKENQDSAADYLAGSTPAEAEKADGAKD